MYILLCGKVKKEKYEIFYILMYISVLHVSLSKYV